MSNAWFKHSLRLAALLVLGVSVTTSTAAAGPGPGPGKRHRLSLFAGFLSRQNANRWDCGLDNAGHVCVDPNGSTTVGGGFWPKGTPDQYVFGSGLQVSGDHRSEPDHICLARGHLGGILRGPKRYARKRRAVVADLELERRQ